MESIFSKKLELKAFEGGSVFPEIEGLNKFNSLNSKKLITLFSDENETGKSTLLEAIAVNWGLSPEGGSINSNFSAKDIHLDLHNCLTVGKSVKRATDGPSLRVESFYNVTTYAENIDLDFSEYGDKSLYYQSHDEGLLGLVSHWFRGNGLCPLDGPETVLSLRCQLALMISIKKPIDGGSQFIIVSHSSILLVMPDSQTVSFDKGSSLEIMYEESMLYRITSLSLNNKDRILSHLLVE